MLTPDYLDGLPEPIVKILQNVEDFMIGDIARRMRKVGDATSTAEIQRIALQTMGESTKAINAKIAEAMGMTQKEVAQIFAQSEQVVTDNQAQIFEAVGIKQDLGFAKRIGQAAVQSAMGDLSNLTRTMGYPTNSGQFTLWTDAYRQALGFAQMQVATGAIDYNTAIRQAIKPFTARGLCSVNYASGRVVSIEAAARQCIIGGVSDMANAIGEKNAKDFGADGWEISAHGDCAPDHEAAQGRQYSNKEYEALNSLLARPIGTLGCRHSAYPILMGISGRAYSDARLAEMKLKNAEGIIYEGRHYTGYEATQMQRQIERSIRKTKRELIGFDKAGLKDDFMTSSIKLRRQREYYDDFSNKAGLLKQNERAQVSGYGRSISGKAVAAEKKVFTTNDESGTISSKRNNMSINKVNSPIEQRNTAKGNPNAIMQFGRPLNNRQQNILNQLPLYDSKAVVSKKDVSMTDLSALTAHTGNEFALFTKGKERLIIRGNSNKVNVNIEYAKQLSEDGYKWSGHTHPGVDKNSLIASIGDKEILKCFSQDVAYIYNSKGEYLEFTKE